jgi:hypothetical protein
MTRTAFVAYIGLPVASFVGYFTSLVWFPGFSRWFLHTEHGAIEWGTAIAFLVAAMIGCRLFWKTANIIPSQYRLFYALFTCAGLLVSLEETSYGQKLLGWSSPEWFDTHNSKHETNLHNMFDNKPSNALRTLATVGCPVCCIVLPLFFKSKGLGGTNRWAHWLVPDGQLTVLAFLTLLLTAFNKVPQIRGMATWSGHLGELKEFYWGVIAVGYAVVLSQRLIPGGLQGFPGRLAPAENQTSHGREAA